MLRKDTINEEDLKNVSGGIRVRGWICPNCKCEISPEDIEMKKTDEDLLYYCPNCKQDYSVSDWGYRLEDQGD